MANLKNTIINDNGFLKISTGNNSQRPSPNTGILRFNSETIDLEYGAGSQFRSQRIDLLSSRLFQTDFVQISDVTGSSNFQEFNCLSTSPNINTGNYSNSSQRITVPEAGYYRIYATCHFSTANSRPAPAVAFSINGSFTQFQSSSSYIRSSAGHNDSSTTQEIIANLSASDQIGIGFRNSSGYGGTVSLDSGQGLIQLEYLGQ